MRERGDSVDENLGRRRLIQFKICNRRETSEYTDDIYFVVWSQHFIRIINLTCIAITRCEKEMQIYRSLDSMFLGAIVYQPPNFVLSVPFKCNWLNLQLII